MSEPLKVGDKWDSGPSDPWNLNPTLKAEIIDLRDGWVRYKSYYNLYDTPQIFASKEGYFRNCYTRKT